MNVVYLFHYSLYILIIVVLMPLVSVSFLNLVGCFISQQWVFSCYLTCYEAFDYWTVLWKNNRN